MRNPDPPHCADDRLPPKTTAGAVAARHEPNSMTCSAVLAVEECQQVVGTLIFFVRAHSFMRPPLRAIRFCVRLAQCAHACTNCCAARRLALQIFSDPIAMSATRLTLQL